MSLKWQRLHISNHESAPLLLFRYSVSKDEYQLYITDLTYIWSECLTRQHILRRAAENSTTIDPSEDPEQLTVLLQKIGEGLRNEPGNCTALSHGPGSDSLQLSTSTNLPAPLQPLNWNIYLSKEPQSSSTAQLLLPLLKAETGRESRQRGLIELLNKKDWVLTKLFDKLEAMGIDTSTVFPGITGLRSSHKGSMMSQAAKYIKGVAPFDEQAWLDETNALSLDPGLASTLLAETSGSSIEDNGQQLGHIKPAPEGWWKTLSATNVPTTSKSPKQKEYNQAVDSRPSQDSTHLETTGYGTETEDDEFERQETPPRLKRRPTSKDKSPSARLDEETESDDEDVKGKQSPVKSPAPRENPPAKLSNGLGIIGGRKKQPSAQESPQPSSLSSPDVDTPVLAPKSPPPRPNSEETESEPDEDGQPAPSSPAPSKPQPSVIPQTKRRGLGVIGGRKKEKQALPPLPSLESEPSSKPQTKTRGLGVIGGKKKERQTSPPPPAQSPEPQTTAPKSHSPAPKQPKALLPPPTEQEKEETEQEKADRKRDELKRQLDAKSKAPTKKKRKF
ncbi:XLF-domain-containing protein [Aspergillus sclerotioniger CBS 115572]|uniref:Non-homologous end-joining factor 1 n=1 Tax=Aspergillus sclerotioniger CBS 115572 TaxID=1450535 RepID=A0A317VK10_9EURO|nr:XLF-domain-containing protein [Aspergillus sclerotioniger CBS 115572]PWY73799.1 XLF-domain-containing protein [Aspergillus sclerotioniger CBS 115572]